jgi:glucose/arabinose dehydrogenase
MGTQHVEWMERRCLFAVVVPSGFIDELYRGGMSNTTAMEFASDGRLFVAEQTGNLRVIDSEGNLLGTPFVSLDVDSAGERGLLGIAFDPAFHQNGFVYLYYTVPNGVDGSPGANNRVSRFTAVDADSNAANGYQPGSTAAPGSELILLNLNALSSATNHNGGALHFGPDAKLYLAVGENASRNNAQSFANFLGKILRMNVDGSAPADNPFNDHDANPAEPADYFWAMGLRNPYTTAFDRVTGRFHINDVGEGTWEEVNNGVAGANYGWPTYEGPESDPNFGTPPIFAYSHSGAGNDGGNVISGGTFYRPVVSAFPSQYTGDYFFAEAGRGWIRSYDVATGTAELFATGASFPVDLKTGNDGALYYLERGTGSVRRIRSNTTPPLPTWLAPGSSATWNGTTLNVFGNATINANPGADAPLIVANTGAANLTVNPASGGLIDVAGITLANGARVTVTNTATDRVLVLNAARLSITGTSALDLTDNDLVIDYAGVSPIGSVATLVNLGFGSGNWAGSGIRSSAVSDPTVHGLGYALNGNLPDPYNSTDRLFSGVGVDGTAVLVKFTWVGDLDIDGRVNFSDLVVFNGSYDDGATSGHFWYEGDFDYKGLVDFSDLVLFNGAYDEDKMQL